MSPPPVEGAEFDAHRDLITIIVQFLCRNKDRGFSAKEIGEAIGIKEDDVNNAMLKLSLTDLVSGLSGGIISRKRASKSQNKPVAIKIEDVTINGILYYRCVET